MWEREHSSAWPLYSPCACAERKQAEDKANREKPFQKPPYLGLFPAKLDLGATKKTEIELGDVGEDECHS